MKDFIYAFTYLTTWNLIFVVPAVYLYYKGLKEGFDSYPVVWWFCVILGGIALLLMLIMNIGLYHISQWEAIKPRNKKRFG